MLEPSSLPTLPFAKTALIVQYLQSAAIVQSVMPSLVKLSLLALYLRLFSSSRPGRIVIWATIVFVSVRALYGVLWNLLSCRPLAKAWDRTIKHGHCLDPAANTLIGYTINAVTDLLVLLIPVPLVASLQLGGRQKLALLAILMIGGWSVLIHCLGPARLQADRGRLALPP